MSVDFTKLRSFVVVVDSGSMSRASIRLGVVQPALSQHIAALETYFQQRLLIRKSTGISPTQAGNVLYRHAQMMLRQLEQAREDVAKSSDALRGQVSIGLSTFSGATSLAIPLLNDVRKRYPDILLSINDSFGHVLSELVSQGRMDLAVIYSFGSIKGLQLQPLFREEFVLVSPASANVRMPPESSIPVVSLEHTPLLLPGGYHFVRRLIEVSFAHAGITPRIAAELESMATLRAALEAGVGATILPRSVVKDVAREKDLAITRLSHPVIQATASLCQLEHQALPPAAAEVREVLVRCAAQQFGSRDLARSRTGAAGRKPTSATRAV